MDVDVAPTAENAHEADEDLIDYEYDILNPLEPDNLPIQSSNVFVPNPKPQDNNVTLSTDEGKAIDENIEGLDENPKASEPSTGTTCTNAVGITDETELVISNDMNDDDFELDVGEVGEIHDENDGLQVSASVAQLDDSVQEIDYANQEGLGGELGNRTPANDESEYGTQDSYSETVGASSTQNHTLEKGAYGTEEQTMEAPASHGADDEIHWEEPDVTESESHTHYGEDASNLVAPKTEFKTELLKTLDGIPPEIQYDEGDELASNGSHGDERSRRTGETDPSFNETETMEGIPENAADLGSDGQKAEPNFPGITVQYRGDEYPMFSPHSEGFFSESSVLDDGMGALMAGFRAELASEISPDDELVFQVDELGLEFTEFRVQDLTEKITLRQILGIFESLVTSNDPDCSRVLYTYLFTKPSVTKRFEFLVESAAAGKGLDEVIHLFESPMPHRSTLITDYQESSDPDELSEIHCGDVDTAKEVNADENDAAQSDGHGGLEELNADHVDHQDMNDVALGGEDSEIANDVDHANEAIDLASDRATQEDEIGDVVDNQVVDYTELEPGSSFDHDTGGGHNEQTAANSMAGSERDNAGNFGEDSAGALFPEDVAPQLAPLQADSEEFHFEQLEQPAPVAEGVFNEVDYEDEGHTASQVGDEPAVSAKRDYTDAELSTGDEKDVKRRRS